MPVTKVTSDSYSTPDLHFTELLNSKDYDFILVDFYADWCGPCMRFAPTLDKLSEQFPRTLFVKVNVDECEELSNEFKITSLPTFLLFEKGNRKAISTPILGADETKVLGLLKTTQFTVSNEDF